MLTQIFASVFLLALCIFFHELGHFLIGKWVGVQPKIFSIGYGRALFYKKVGRTLYQITAIPLGGFVQFYGDDITKEKSKLRKGDFFSVGPWRRIALAVGGPLFSVLLGIIVLFFLYVFGYQNISNRVQLVEGKQPFPAQQAGLQNGDKIIQVNGRNTYNFEKINYLVGFSNEADVSLLIERNGSTLEKTVTARRPEAGLPFQIGIQPMGSSKVMVTHEKKLVQGGLKEKDIILFAAGTKINKVEDLHAVVNEHIGEEIELKIERAQNGFLSGSKKEVSVIALVNEAETLLLQNLTDNQTGVVLEDMQINSWGGRNFEKIFVNDKNFVTWSELKEAIRSHTSNDGVLHFRMEAVHFTAKPVYQKRGLMGISLAELIEPERAQIPRSFLSFMHNTIDQSWFIGESTLVGLGAVITGKLSFNKSMAGPVKIVSFAAQSVEQGWGQYWYLLAHITIILGVMNMLPIPVLDGGHVVFYLIEAFYKPLKASTIAVAVRVGMVFLLTFGVYVIGHDIWDVFLKKFFG